MVSIIIPAYNVSAYISRCIDSILNMAYYDYEAIVINDGSTDSTLNILQEYAKKNHRLRVINKKNGGSASARNLGLEVAKGEFIAFVDADDYVDSQYLSTLVETQTKYDADIVECGFCTVKGETKLATYTSRDNVSVLNNIQKLEELCIKETYLKSISPCNKLYKRELYDGIKFPEGKGIDDEFVIHRIIAKAKKIVTISDVLYYYYMSENSQMRSKISLKGLDSIEAIEDQLEMFREIGNIHLYNMLLYRYYRSVIGGYHLVKKYFPEERDRLKELKIKKKKYYRALIISETSPCDKVFLIMNYYFPEISKKLHNRLAGENEISKKKK